MGFSRRLIVQVLRNCNPNHVWLRALQAIASRAGTDPDYACRTGCVLTVPTPAVSKGGTGAATKIFGQAIVARSVGAARHTLSRRGSASPGTG
jgi:hypothetical protein